MSNRKIITAAATGGIGYYPTGAASDTYYDNVSLLLNGDVEVDSNFANVSLLLDGNTLTDKSNNKITVTANGDAKIVSNNKKFGTGSIFFDGSGDYLNVPATSAIDFSAAFTIEFWMYPTAYPANSFARILMHNVNNTPNSLVIAVTSTGLINSGLAYACTGIESTTAVPLNIWTHVALSVTGTNGTGRLFLNGVLSATVSGISTETQNVSPLYIGVDPSLSGIPSVFSYYAGYLDDFRITKGVARYTSSFTPPVKALPTHEILDSSVYRLPVTAYGNARIDTTTKKYGTGAMYFDGNGDYINIATTSALTIGTGDFTYEAWIHPLNLQASKAGEKCIYYTGQSGILISLWNNNVHLASDYVADLADFSSTSVVNGSWFHLAITRSGTTVSCFINGQQAGSNVTLSTNFGTNGLNIGRYSNASMEFQGYMDDLRITKGVARYTANFTLPTTSLPTIPPTISADPWWGNVSLLLDGNTTDAYDPYWQNVSLMLTGDDFIDWSNQHNAITNNGTVTLDTTNKKFNASSLAFSGTKYLSMPSNSAFEFGTGDFTVECWIRFTTVQDCAFFQTSNEISAAVGPFWLGYTSGKLYASRHGSASYALGYTWTPTTGVWYHVAATRQSGTTNVYLNGSVVATSSTIHNGVSFTQAGAAVGVLTTPAYFQGQIADLRITKGVARTITVPAAALPTYKIQDRTQNNLTVTPYGNVQLSTDVMKNGTGSMFFDGTGDYILFPSNDNFGFGTGDFTVEAWIFPPSYPTYAYICAVTNNPGGFVFYINAGSIKIRTWYTADLLSATAPSLNVWSHVAAVRSGTTLSIFVNGVSVASTTTNSTNFPINALRVGSDGTGGEWNGYIDDLRITKGYARYTQNFTPPSQSFATQYISTGYDANYADVSLLLNGNGTNGSTTFTDLSSSPTTITAYGDAKISTAVKKYGVGSMYFDGTGDYLTLPISPSLVFEADFTIECWCYRTYMASGYDALFTTKWNVAWDYQGNTDPLVFSASGFHGLGNQWTTYSSGASVPQDKWTHAAVTKSGSTVRFFIDGVIAHTLTHLGNVGNSTWPSGIGVFDSYGGAPRLFWYGYIDDFRITKGYARYTTNFTPPTYQLPTNTTGTVIDPLRASTSLLLRGNGTNGSTSFTDESPNGLTVTNNGSVTVNTTTKKYGAGSMAFSGGNYLTIANDVGHQLGAGDFTVECWVYFSNITGEQQIVQQFTGSNGPGWTLYKNSAHGIGFYAGSTEIHTTVAVSASTWYHIAVSRIGTFVNLFINGISGTSGTYANFTTSTDPLLIGNRVTSSTYLNGYIDDLRITKGYARYTANFTPPAYEDPIVTGTVYDYNYPQVSLLLNGDGTNGSQVFKDLSSSTKTVTAYDNAQISTAQKKFGTGSMYFDGTGDYLSVAYQPEFGFESNDFTIECWAYISSFTPSSGPVFASNWGNPSSYGAWAFGAGNTGSVTLSVNLRNSSAAAFQISAPAGTVTTGQWYHYAVTRTGSVFYIFVNGVQKATGSYSTAVDNNSTPILLGRQAYNYDNYGTFNGYIDDFRITKGLARYTQNFTPPTAPLPTSYS